jgi:hypothetical protein
MHCKRRVGAPEHVPSVFHNLMPVYMPANVHQYFTSKVKGNLPALVAPDAATAEITGTQERYAHSPGMVEGAVAAQKTAESESQRPYKRCTRRRTECSYVSSVRWDSLPRSQPCGAALQTAPRASNTR